MRTNTRMLILAALFLCPDSHRGLPQVSFGGDVRHAAIPVYRHGGRTSGGQVGGAVPGGLCGAGPGGPAHFHHGGGLGYVFQPSFGFLLGLIPSAWVMGKLTEGRRSSRGGPGVSGRAGCALPGGLPYMYLILNVYLGKGLSAWTVAQIGMLVYLPGDALKIAATAAVYRPLRKAAGPTAGTAPRRTRDLKAADGVAPSRSPAADRKIPNIQVFRQAEAPPFS